MDFLADVETICEACGGTRYKPEVLEVGLDGKTDRRRPGHDHERGQGVLCRTAGLGRPHWPSSRRSGLGYLRLGQPLDTLSGGEAQRLKLATGLARPAKGESLYVFDEPTTGLHFVDIEKLLKVFARLLGAGHTSSSSNTTWTSSPGPTM